MVSRKTAMSISNAYICMFSYSYSSRYGTEEKVCRDNFYDFLYERDYEAWFCNMVKSIFNIRDLKEWLLRIHTGESFVSATTNWPWDKRQALGQVYLKNLARDFILYYQENNNQWTIKKYKGINEELIRRIEMDGYVFRDRELFQTEMDVLDVEMEKGLLEKLHTSLNLTNQKQTFEFLKLTEDHYIAGRWSDSISNARKFFEVILQQVACKHSISVKNTSFGEGEMQKPLIVRDYLEREGLLEKKEREAVDKIYALLSHTGSHPYMAEKDQARLLRQICLTMTQFIMLRLEGSLIPKENSNK
ncbi:MAG: hypothetical protein WC491_06255 [Candidatus Omnitrophota bacterium]